MSAYLITVVSRLNDVAPQQLYLIDGDLSPDAITYLSAELLHDPVVHSVNWQDLETLAYSAHHQPLHTLEVAFRPGVTDNEAESIRVGIEHLGMSMVRMVKTLRRYHADLVDRRQVCNDLIQLTFYDDGRSAQQRAIWYRELLHMPDQTQPLVAHVPLANASDEDLLRISRAGVLALDLEEMQTIQAYFRQEGRDPSDGELETLAQTWSEHCSHKTFKARVHYHTSESDAQTSIDTRYYPALTMLAGAYNKPLEIDSLIKTFLMRATSNVLDRRAQEPDPKLQVLSAFVDNAGIVAFNDEYELSIKVETHNHPSALEPFGGANTGVGGVVRDVLGVSAQPIANTDILCFGRLDTPDESLSDGVLPPRRIAEGVVAGVRDYGNKLGIPTVNGAVLYNTGYTSNPLVYCGTVGLAPRGKHPRQVQAADRIVVLGGRTGRDGIHGATFSSVELTHTTAEQVGSAVQIGDPITEKKVIDVVLQARDAGLYSAITDCGAGGLSSAVGEMGEASGAQVMLERVPLKYAGLQPWEIWLSEAQERMVLAVPPQHLEQLLQLCASEEVEASDIGYFTGDGRLRVCYETLTVVDLDMAFLHGGRPQRQLEAVWTQPVAHLPTGRAQAGADLHTSLLGLLAHPNISSKANIIRSYDHEVQGRTVIKPLVGIVSDGPGDAAVLKPLRSSMRGAAISAGINPLYGMIDPYWMALACVDEALRNIVAVGGDPSQTVILDNFCWGDPRRPDRMAGLVRAAAGCYDAALAFGTPFVSGKDSLNNEYLAADGTRTPIPPTLLISALALVPDIRQCVTMDLKQSGNLIYVVGLTKAELAGSHYVALEHDLSDMGAATTALPHVDLAAAPAIMRTIHRAITAGCVRSCHDISEGGLAVAAAEMSIAGRLGMQLRLAALPHTVSSTENALSAILLFSESSTRFLIEVQPEQKQHFEAIMAGLPCAHIGEVLDRPDFMIYDPQDQPVLHADLASLNAAWQQQL